MENNQINSFDDKSIFKGDFQDFEEDDEFALPELDEDIATQEEIDETLQEKLIDNCLQEKPIENLEQINNLINEDKKTQEENTEPNTSNNIADDSEKTFKFSPSPWDELKEENPAVKKYLFYISKDFIPYLDELNTDERSAYINDAIQKKIDIEAEEKKKNSKKRIAIHFIIMIFTFILASPLVLMISHKAIMATFDNYKYSQENFEKLYKARFKKSTAYMRSIQYNKEQSLKSKH